MMVSSREVTEGSGSTPGAKGMLGGSDRTSKALTRHLGVMRQTTEGTPEGDHVTPIYWAAELRRGRTARLPVSSYIVSSCGRIVKLAEGLL